MDREQILAKKPGPETDVLIAEYIFGWRKMPGPKTDYDGPCESYDVLIPPTIDDPFPLYPPRGAIKPWCFCHLWSTDLPAAWEVAEKFERITIERTVHGSEHGWCCEVFTYDNGYKLTMNYAYAEKAPEAICKAALLSKLAVTCK